MFNISQVIQDSLKLAWKHKILWVFALMVAGGMSTNPNFGGGGGGDSDFDMQEVEMFFEDLFDDVQGYVLSDTDEINIPLTAEEEAEQALSEVFEEDFDADFELEEPGISLKDQGELSEEFTPMVLGYLENVLRRSYVQIGFVSVSFIAFILFVVFVTLFTFSWAKGAFLHGIDKAIKNTDYTLRDLGTKGRISMREIFKFRVFIFVLWMIALAVLGTVGTLTVMFEGPARAFLLVLSVVFILALFIFAIIVNAAEIFSFRYIALKSTKYVDAFKNGVRLFKNRFVDVLILTISNCFIAGLISIGFFIVIISIGAGIGFGVYGLFTGDFSIALQMFAGALLVPVSIGAVLAFTALGAYLTTYTNFTWSFLFNDVADKVDDKEVLQSG